MSISIVVLAQEERKHIRDGNKSYNDSKFEESEISYRKAIDKSPNSFNAAFNLGDALYKQEKYEEAANQFQALASRDLSKEDLAKVYHNLGNSYLQAGKYQESIDSYKQALRNNANDLETKYNLSYAMRMIQQQQQNKDQNQENDDKNKEQQEQQNKDKQEQEKEQQNQEQQKEKENKEQQEQQNQEISKEDAQRMLDAMQNDEKEAQEKMKKAQVRTQKVKVEKDW